MAKHDAKQTPKHESSDFDVKIFYFPEIEGHQGKTNRVISFLSGIANVLAGAFRAKHTKIRRPSSEK
jgi:hypothetical protein